MCTSPIQATVVTEFFRWTERTIQISGTHHSLGGAQGSLLISPTFALESSGQLMSFSAALVFFGKKCHNSHYTMTCLSVYCSHLSWRVLTLFITLSRLDSTALGTEYEPYRYLLNKRVSR